MVAESIGIVSVIFIMAFMSIRAGKPTLAILSIPLTSISLLHIIGNIFFGRLSGTLLYIFGGGGLVIGIVSALIISNMIETGRIRAIYLTSAIFFLVALGYVYMR